MAHKFYSDIAYRTKQSNLMKANWQNGSFDFLIKKEKRTCARKECKNVFELAPSDPKIYCDSSCAAKFNNAQRGAQPLAVRQKISAKLKSLKIKGRPSPLLGVIKVPRIEVVCTNSQCKKVFFAERWKKKKFCSNMCTIRTIGKQPTSPRASRGKAGIRRDISSKLYFYSRWEANVARLFNFLGIKWCYQYRTFDLVEQSYTPDFYLPDYNTYIEVKNFWWKYSIIRDRKFRRLYPDVKLEVVIKNDYQIIEQEYAELIPNWEYKNSKFLKGD